MLQIVRAITEWSTTSYTELTVLDSESRQHFRSYRSRAQDAIRQFKAAKPDAWREFIADVISDPKNKDSDQ